MKVIHLISGGDTGGAKTHVHSLLQGLTSRIQVSMVCFTDGPFVHEARQLGIDTAVLAGRNLPRVLAQLCSSAAPVCPSSPPSTPTISWTSWAVPSPG